MALLFIDGFDLYNAAADLTRSGWSTSNAPTFSTPRLGSGRSVSLQSVSVISRSLPSNLSTIIIGHAMLLGSVTTSTQWRIRLIEGSTVQMTIQNEPTGAISAYRGSSATLLGQSSTNVLLPNQWCYVECRVVLHGTTGAVTVNANGVQVLNLTSVNTISSANAYANSLSIGNSNGGGPLVDDLYIMDTTGTPNAFLGDCRVDSLAPAADVSTAWTRTGGSLTNASAVSEARLETTNYVTSSTVGQIDRYSLASLPHSPLTVHAVAPVYHAADSDAGARTVRSKVYSAGGTFNGASTQPSTSGGYIRDITTVDPATGSAWTVAAVNAANLGIEIVS